MLTIIRGRRANFDEIDKNIIQAIDLLVSLSPSDIIHNSEAIASLNLIKNNQVQPNLLLEKKLDCLLNKILLELYENESLLQLQNADSLVIQHQDTVSIMETCLAIIYYSSMNSVKFARESLINDGLEAHFCFLKNTTFIQQALRTNFMKDDNLIFNLADYLILNVYIYSKNCEENLNKWIELDALSTLINLAKLKPDTQIQVFLTVANIATDKQIEDISDIPEVLDLIQKKISLIAQSFREKNFDRYPRQIIDDNKIVDVNVHCISQSNGLKCSLLVFLSGLYRLSVNDKIRSKIYFENNFKHNLKTILFEGNEIETKYALRLFAQLSFDNQIAADLSNDAQLFDFLKNKSIDTLSEQIFWNINQSKILNEEKISKTGEHIMISYNSASRDLCLKIKSKLEQNGLKVWIDVEKISGQCLQSMAQAIENSYCVLICLSEKYRQSINCQSEALYAFRLNKPIIPLIMQKGYENVKGWLGLIISDKIFVNFTKYSFEECMKRLNRELKNLECCPEIIKLEENKEKPVEKWNEDEVKEWFRNNFLNESILNFFEPCNGIILKQIYEMRRDAPEFFYQSFRNLNIDMNSILNFTHKLKNIFESK